MGRVTSVTNFEGPNKPCPNHPIMSKTMFLLVYLEKWRWKGPEKRVSEGDSGEKKDKRAIWLIQPPRFVIYSHWRRMWLTAKLKMKPPLIAISLAFLINISVLLFDFQCVSSSFEFDYDVNQRNISSLFSLFLSRYSSLMVLLMIMKTLPRWAKCRPWRPNNVRPLDQSN